jgi:hypothetical protein
VYCCMDYQALDKSSWLDALGVCEMWHALKAWFFIGVLISYFTPYWTRILTITSISLIVGMCAASCGVLSSKLRLIMSLC